MLLYMLCCCKCLFCYVVMLCLCCCVMLFCCKCLCYVIFFYNNMVFYLLRNVPYQMFYNMNFYIIIWFCFVCLFVFLILFNMYFYIIIGFCILFNMYLYIIIWFSTLLHVEQVVCLSVFLSAAERSVAGCLFVCVFYLMLHVEHQIV